MQEVTLNPIHKSVKRLLNQLEKDMCVAEHQTGPFGQVPMRKKKKTLVPDDIADETRMVKKINALQKMDGGDPGINAGMGTTDEDKNESQASRDDALLPQSVLNESGLGPTKKVKPKSLLKTSYEYIASETPYTDESNPAEDVFYIPDNIDMESSDTDKKAKEKEKKKKRLQQEYGRIDENISDAGAARVKQQYNTGAIENAQIGGQGR